MILQLAAAACLVAAPAAGAPRPSIRIVGYGVAVEPKVPFQATRPPAGPAVEGEPLMGARMTRAGLVNFIVAKPKKGSAEHGAPIADSGLRVDVQGAKRPADVGEFTAGPKLAHWELELGRRCNLVWVDGYAVKVERVNPMDFTLSGFGAKANTEVELSGPFASAPDIDQLAPADEKLTQHGQSAGSVWAELEYLHDGAPWIHRVYYVPMGGGAVFLASARARADKSKQLIVDVETTIEDFLACRHPN